MTGVGTQTSHAMSGRGDRWSTLRGPVASFLWTALVITVLVAAYALAPWDHWSDASSGWKLALWFAVAVVAVVLQVRAVMRSTHPWLRAMQGALLTAAMLLLPFSATYVGMSQTDPTTFNQPLSRLDAVYFTVTVFSTVGFGDVVPVSEAARVIVTGQMLADLVLIGVIVKVLIGAAQHRREVLKPPDAPASPRE